MIPGAPQIPADLLVPPAGYTGPTPTGEVQFAVAAATTAGALQQCTGQLAAIADIVTPR